MSTTALKIIALIFMTVDHIGSFIPNTPIWFHYIGRLAYPLFAFSAAWGFYYTHDKKLYMKRMYKCSLLMCVIDIIIPLIFDTFTSYNSGDLDNNIFASILFADIIIYLIEITKGDKAKRKKYITLFVLYQIGTIIVYYICDVLIFNKIFIPGIELLERVPFTAMCSLLSTEGPLYLTLMLVLIYFSMDSKKKLARNYLIYNVGFFAIVVTDFIPKGLRFMEMHSANGGGLLLNMLQNCFGILGFRTFGMTISENLYTSMFKYNYQWMMIFALLFMLLYNGKKGSGFKNLFYTYYPLHIVILYCIGTVMQNI